MTQNPGAWPPCHIEVLTTMWAKGKSATEISNAIRNAFPGAEYSRSAVLGKLHRIGVASQGREAASSPRKATRAPPVKRAAAQNNGLAIHIRKFGIAGRGTVFEEAEARPPRVVVAFPSDGPGLRTIMNIGFAECRWPCGEPGPDFTFCGQHAPEGPYCAGHKARSIKPPVPGRPRNATELARSLRRYV